MFCWCNFANNFEDGKNLSFSQSNAGYKNVCAAHSSEKLHLKNWTGTSLSGKSALASYKPHCKQTSTVSQLENKKVERFMSFWATANDQIKLFYPKKKKKKNLNSMSSVKCSFRKITNWKSEKTSSYQSWHNIWNKKKAPDDLITIRYTN